MDELQGLGHQHLGSHPKLVKAYQVLRMALANIAKYGPGAKNCRAQAEIALERAARYLGEEQNDAA